MMKSEMSKSLFSRYFNERVADPLTVHSASILATAFDGYGAKALDLETDECKRAVLAALCSLRAHRWACVGAGTTLSTHCDGSLPTHVGEHGPSLVHMVTGVISVIA